MTGSLWLINAEDEWLKMSTPSAFLRFQQKSEWNDCREMKCLYCNTFPCSFRARFSFSCRCVSLPGSRVVLWTCMSAFQADFHWGHPQEQIPGSGLQVPLQWADAGADQAGECHDWQTCTPVWAHSEQESLQEPRWRLVGSSALCPCSILPGFSSLAVSDFALIWWA